MVGRVIGKGGETIKALQQYTGAMIQIDQSVDPTKVTIAGTPSSLQLAVSMVTDIVRGSFKGFALLRQVSSRAGATQLSQPQPVYVEGYGFVPLSQQFGADGTGDSSAGSDDLPEGLSAGDLMLMAAQQKYNLRSQSLPTGSSKHGEVCAADLASGFHAPLLASLAQAGGGADTLANLNLDLPRLTTDFDLSPPRSPTSPTPPPLPNGWMHITDPDGRPFFYNLLTKQSQWQQPIGP